MKNLYIIEKKAREFENIICNDKELSIGEEKVQIENIHACLYCESLKNITIIICAEKIYKVSLVLGTEDAFHGTLAKMLEVCENVEFSEQNKKINGYTTALVDKLREGIELTIIETKEQGEIPVCPDCGMQCDPGIPYCMECGAAI